MPTIFFIGDDHETDNWITTGWNSISGRIGQATFMLLLEVDRNGNKDTEATLEDLDTILEDKPDSNDAHLLRQVLTNCAQARAFDAPGREESPRRHEGQATNISYYVDKYSQNFNFFVVVVGDAHLHPPEGITWIALQDYDYGPGINTLVGTTP